MDRTGNSSGGGSGKTMRSSATLKKQATYSASSRSLRSVSGLGKSRQSTKSMMEQGPQVVVRDDEGKNVTPMSLLNLKSVAKAPTQASVMQSGAGTPTSDVSEIMERMSSSFSFMSFTSSGTSTPESVASEESASSPRTTVDDVTEDDAHTEHTGGDKEKKERVEPTEPEPDLSEADLEKVVTLRLEETSTIWMLDIAGSCVAIDGPFADDVQVANDKYKELKKLKIGNERFVERSMQTFNLALKTKDVSANPVASKEAGAQASVWDIHDETHVATDPTQKRDLKDLIGATTTKRAGRQQQVAEDPFLAEMEKESEAWLEAEAALDAGNKSTKSTDTGVTAKEAELPGAIESSLRIVERAVTQNMYHRKQLLYRNIGEGKDKPLARDDDEGDDDGEGEDGVDAGEDSGAAGAGGDEGDEEERPVVQPTLEPLWIFKCDLARGRNVSAMVWNPANADILAVGYGEFSFSKQRASGLVLLWSLKNPVYPERVIHANAGVTALDFSTAHPNLLGVGLYDGSVAVYDVRTIDDNKPLVDSSQTTGTHSDPVWQLSWVDRGSERGESLVSVSSDGRITQWSIQKGIEYTDLMRLKRISNPTRTSDSKSEAFISRLASGLCIDFLPSDTNIYLCGTEDGNIHKCSASYNEQFLENYFGHSGPIYRIKWSPFHQGAFLSASADWSIRLWQEDKDEACLVFQSYTDYVADLCWSKFSSTVFGCVTGDGRVDVWDLHASQLDPIISHREHGRKISAVLFSENSPVLVTGDNAGNVNVYKLRGVDLDPAASAEDQKIRLEKAMHPTVLTE